MCLSVSVYLLVTFVSHTKTAQPIEMRFDELTRVGPWNHVLDGGSTSLTARGNFRGVRPIEKHWESLVRCTQQKNHSIVNNNIEQKGSFHGELGLQTTPPAPSIIPDSPLEFVVDDEARRHNSLDLHCDSQLTGSRQCP